MRPEKKFLVEEARKHLGSSSHVYLVKFTGVNVSDAAALRKALAECGAQYHVIKNSIINIAAKELNLPDVGGHLNGQTGVIAGGEDAAAVAKVLVNFFKTRENSEIKVGILGEKVLSKAEIDTLGSLPSLKELRAQLLALLSTPASQMVRVMSMYVEKQEGGEKKAE